MRVDIADAKLCPRVLQRLPQSYGAAVYYVADRRGVDIATIEDTIAHDDKLRLVALIGAAPHLLTWARMAVDAEQHKVDTFDDYEPPSWLEELKAATASAIDTESIAVSLKSDTGVWHEHTVASAAKYCSSDPPAACDKCGDTGVLRDELAHDYMCTCHPQYAAQAAEAEAYNPSPIRPQVRDSVSDLTTRWAELDRA